MDDEGRVLRIVRDAKGNRERVPSLDHIGTQINAAKAKIAEYRDCQYEAAHQAGPLRDAITSAEMALRELGWKPDAWQY